MWVEKKTQRTMVPWSIRGCNELFQIDVFMEPECDGYIYALFIWAFLWFGGVIPAMLYGAHVAIWLFVSITLRVRRTNEAQRS